MPRKANPGRDVSGGMGQSLINKRKNAHWKKQANTQYAGVHVSDSAVDGGVGRLASVTDRHELDDFLCVTLDHEVLVRDRGWIPIFDVNRGNHVWSLEGLGVHAASWSEVQDSRTVKLAPGEPLYEIQTERLKILTNGSHVNWAQRANSANQVNGQWEKRRSDAYWPSCSYLPVGACDPKAKVQWDLARMPFLPADINTNDAKNEAWCEFLGFFIGDGSLTMRNIRDQRRETVSGYKETSKFVNLHQSDTSAAKVAAVRHIKEFLTTLGWWKEGDAAVDSDDASQPAAAASSAAASSAAASSAVALPQFQLLAGTEHHLAAFVARAPQLYDYLWPMVDFPNSLSSTMPMPIRLAVLDRAAGDTFFQDEDEYDVGSSAAQIYSPSGANVKHLAPNWQQFAANTSNLPGPEWVSPKVVALKEWKARRLRRITSAYRGLIFSPFVSEESGADIITAPPKETQQTEYPGLDITVEELAELKLILVIKGDARSGIKIPPWVDWYLRRYFYYPWRFRLSAMQARSIIWGFVLADGLMVSLAEKLPPEQMKQTRAAAKARAKQRAEVKKQIEDTTDTGELEQLRAQMSKLPAIPTPKPLTGSTSSIPLLADMVTVAAMAGWQASINVVTEAGTKLDINKTESSTNVTGWVVHFHEYFNSDTQLVTTSAQGKGKPRVVTVDEHKKTEVACVTVKAGNFLVRRKEVCAEVGCTKFRCKHVTSHPVFTGNCDALLKETEFEVQHSSMVILSTDVIHKPKADHQLFEYETIPIPRRPAWDAETTHEELDKREREAFMKWRRELATMEESLDERQLTPFEKNLEVWKQLWRVLERSHIVVQILDARNPLLFRSKDMEAYVKELSANKTLLLVINKADYLTPQARRTWSEYFTKKGIDFVFWSAALEQARLDDLDRKRRRKENRGGYHGHSVDDVDEGRIKGASSDEEEDDSEAEEEEEEDDEDDEKTTLKASSLWKTAEQSETPAVDKAAAAASASSAAAAAAPAAASAAPAAASAAPAAASSSSSSSAAPQHPHHASHQIFTRDALFAHIIAKFVNSSAENKAHFERGERITVGMTGYPNVGKSSTINVLAGAKKVTVGATPGKTKHFQTINVTDQITLCDCPGLVFPTFLSSRAELVCNGIMPIDQIKDWKNIWAPVQLLCEKVSRAQIQQTYSLIFPSYKELGADELLNSYARMRSFYKDHGRPDEAHAARIILKDFAAGKLLYCHPPPELSFPQRRAFYRSFVVGGEVMIHEALWEDAETLLQAKRAQVARSVEGLGANEEKQELAGIVGMRIAPPSTKLKTKFAAQKDKPASIDETKEGDDEDEEGEDDEDEDDEDTVAAVRASRATVNQAAYDALLRDDLESAVMPTQQNREAAKLLEQGFNPDGTPLSKKQRQRLNQRNKKKTGKAFKLRKTTVAQVDVAARTGGKSSDAASRLGVFHDAASKLGVFHGTPVAQ